MLFDDYIIEDSSQQINEDFGNSYALSPNENGIRVGIVRRVLIMPDESIGYQVEMFVNGKQIPVPCKPITRFGGVYNYEEFNLRPWDPNKLDENLSISADSYEYRAGDVVVVGLLGNDDREGVIFGGLNHPARSQKITDTDIQYYSIFNGLEKQIRADGSYKVTFNGAATTEKKLSAPVSDAPIIEPVYNPSIAGSYYGFDTTGSFVITDSNPVSEQMVKVFKDASSGSIILKSGQAVVELGGSAATGQFGAKASSITLDALQSVDVTSKLKMNVKGTQVSIKGVQVAIGNDTVELVSALVELIAELGQVVVNSPVGTCTPVATSPNWAAKVIPLQVKLQTLAGSLEDPEPFELKGDDSSDIGEDL